MGEVIQIDIKMKKDSETLKTKIAVMQNDIEHIKGSLGEIKSVVEEIKKNMEDKYVTKTEYTPVKQIVYGIVGLILTTVFGAMLSIIVK